jgi:MFS family permease
MHIFGNGFNHLLDQHPMTSVPSKNRGWFVVFAGLTINLALGILYSWSIFKDASYQSIKTGGEGAFTWDVASLNDPYAVCILVFAFTTIVAGKIQDSKGPKITAAIGGVLVAAGFCVLAFTTSYALWVFGFGILAGIGIGFGYASATPPAWLLPLLPLVMLQGALWPDLFPTRSEGCLPFLFFCYFRPL